MKSYKILSYLIIASCALGIWFAIGERSYINRIFALGINSIAIAFLVNALRTNKYNWGLLMTISVLQLFSFKMGAFGYMNVIGLGFIEYFEIDTMRHTSEVLSLTSIKIYNPDLLSEPLIGINIIAVLFIIYLLVFKPKVNVYAK